MKQLTKKFSMILAAFAVTVSTTIWTVPIASAGGSSTLRICNSPNSLNRVRLSSTAHERNGFTIYPGFCANGNNTGGRLRVQIESMLVTPDPEQTPLTRSYQQGEDGLGWHQCVNMPSDYGDSFSDPVNNPPGGIVRYKTWGKTNCHN